MNKYPRIARFVGEMPWAILESKLVDVMEFLNAKFAGEDIELSEEIIAARLGSSRNGPEPYVVGNLGIVPLFGVLSPRVNLLSEISGATSTEKFAANIREFAASDEIATIVLDVNSPGGAVGGLLEAAEEIRNARKIKPVVAVANDLAASAAYWLASSASELVVTPSGQVGSIGVFTSHADISERQKQEGVKVSLIHAGKFKVENHPYAPLSDEARAHMQERVDKVYSMFVKDVAIGRDVSIAKVKNDFGQGRMLLAKDAKAAGMVDRIATMNDTIIRLLRKGRQSMSGERAEMTVRDLETILRDEGRFSNTQAKAMASRAFQTPAVEDDPRDEDSEENKETLAALRSIIQAFE